MWQNTVRVQHKAWSYKLCVYVKMLIQAAPAESAELGVRINAPSNERALAGSDLEVILQSERLEAVVVPKFESVEDATFVAQYATQVHTYSYVSGRTNQTTTPARSCPVCGKCLVPCSSPSDAPGSESASCG